MILNDKKNIFIIKEVVIIGTEGLSLLMIYLVINYCKNLTREPKNNSFTSFTKIHH
jgi:hypothetical protein